MKDLLGNLWNKIQSKHLDNYDQYLKDLELEKQFKFRFG